jgi:hypothetical protein
LHSATHTGRHFATGYARRRRHCADDGYGADYRNGDHDGDCYRHRDAPDHRHNYSYSDVNSHGYAALDCDNDARHRAGEHAYDYYNAHCHAQCHSDHDCACHGNSDAYRNDADDAGSACHANRARPTSFHTYDVTLAPWHADNTDTRGIAVAHADTRSTGYANAIARRCFCRQ